MTDDQPPRRSCFIGRWQPLHEGHVALIRTALDEGRDVVIGIMDTPGSERNPHTYHERMWMFIRRFGPDRLTFVKMPWIDEVVYGRECGWRCREIRLDAETEAISGTETRRGTHDG